MLLRPSIRRAATTGLVVLPLLVATPVLAGPPKTAAASETPKDKARSLAQDGIKAFEAGNHQQALDLFTQAESLFHAPVHGLFMARANAGLGKLVAAKALYAKVAAESLDASAPPAWVSARDAAKKELDEIDHRIPRIVLTVTPADAPELSVTMNDVALPSPVGGSIEVDPGTYVFKARSRELSASSKVEAKERATVNVRLALGALSPVPTAPVPETEGPKRPRPSPLRPVALGAIAVGGVAVVAGAVVGGLSAKKRSDANSAFDACEVKYGKRQCQGPEEANVKSLDKSATAMGNAGVGLIAGGAAVAAAGVVLFLVSGPKGDAAPTRTGRALPAVLPSVGPGFLGIDGRF